MSAIDEASLCWPVEIDLRRSAGPWCVWQNGQITFDATDINRGLGYNHSCLFGILQQAAVWTNDWNDPELIGLINAAIRLLRRAPKYQSWFDENWMNRDDISKNAVSSLDVFDGGQQSQIEIDQADRLQISDLPKMVGTYIAASMSEQFHQVAVTNLTRLQELIEPYIDLQTNLIEACQLVDGDHLSIRFNATHTILQPRLIASSLRFDWIGDSIANIHLPLGIGLEEINWLAQSIVHAANAGLKSSFNNRPDHADRSTISATLAIEQQSLQEMAIDLLQRRDVARYYGFHIKLIEYKLRSTSTPIMSHELIDFLTLQLPATSKNLQFASLDRNNWDQWRSQVDTLQSIVYEPARQTAICKYDRLIEDSRGLGLLICNGRQIAGMAFAGPLSLFPEERGTLTDPARYDPETLYMLDLTVTPEYRGRLGSLLKQGITLLAVTQGRTAIHGRNRDRLAAGMWAINLALGSFELQHLVDDYLDDEPYRDCIYYRCPLVWPSSIGNNTTGDNTLREIRSCTAIDVGDIAEIDRLAKIVNFYI